MNRKTEFSKVASSADVHNNHDAAGRDSSSSSYHNKMMTIPPNSYSILRSFDWHEFACGWGAAFINISVTYPIYKMIFRQILHGIRITSAYEQLRSEGFIYLYRGIFPPLAQKTISLSIMFGVFDGIRKPLVENFHVNPYNAKIIAGLVSGSAEAILLPLERVQTVLAHSNYHKYFKNTAGAFRYILINHGFTELYRGLVPVVWRNGASNALFFILREEANSLLPSQSSVSTKAAQEFIAGAIIGASLSTLFYPLNVIKVAMQSQMGHKNESLFVVGYRIYVERGRKIKYFYRGIWFNLTRAFLSWGIMNAAYERIKKIIY